jgi:hypothetical protein
VLSEDNVVEGGVVEGETKLEMFKFDHIYFAVLVNVDYEIAKNLQIMSYDIEHNTSIEMAGGTSTN